MVFREKGTVPFSRRRQQADQRGGQEAHPWRLSLRQVFGNGSRFVQSRQPFLKLPLFKAFVPAFPAPQFTAESEKSENGDQGKKKGQEAVLLP